LLHQKENGKKGEKISKRHEKYGGYNDPYKSRKKAL